MTSWSSRWTASRTKHDAFHALQAAGIGTRLGLAPSLLDWHWLPLFPMFVIFFISALAETNRPPFDLPEAESELVAGFAVEYSSTAFLLFFLGEYTHVVTISFLTIILFFGGWHFPWIATPESNYIGAWLEVRIPTTSATDYEVSSTGVERPSGG